MANLLWTDKKRPFLGLPWSFTRYTITPEKLRRIEAGEGLLKELGFPVCRLRVQGDLCRIEVPKDQIVRAAELHETLSEQLTALGFSFVTLDLKGFRSGSYDAAAGFVKKEALP